MDPKDGIQRDATDAIIGAFVDDGQRRATAVLPGGAGKTVLGLRVAEALAARGELESALVLLPSLLQAEVVGQGVCYRLQLPLKAAWAVT